MKKYNPIDDFSGDWETQDRLYALKCDIRIGEKSDFGKRSLTTYQQWQTQPACRYAGDPWNVVLMIDLAAAYDVQLYCDESNDSFGDWIVAHGLWDGEAA